MANNNNHPYSSSSTFRFHGFLTQPESDPFNPYPNSDPLELHESDVVWSFAAVSSDSYSFSNSSPPSHHHHVHHRPRVNSPKSGLSAALSEDDHHLICRKSTLSPKVIPQAKLMEDIPSKYHQSAPVNIPMWPKEYSGDYRNDNQKWFDDVEEEEEEDVEDEMVPPHVIVARSHVTFSVFEGVGRTLKGRDLRRVRNAVFQQTGFID